MNRTIATACLLAILPGGVCAWQTPPQAPAIRTAATAKKKTIASKKAPSKKAVEVTPPTPPPPAQEAPPLPATLMNSAPVRPSVTMESGLLTIDAPNSTLSDVLSGVRKATGASIEGASPSERVAVKLGPGAPEQVVAALLRGTPYDYVILGTLGRRDVVTKILLTQQSSQSASVSGGQPAPQPAYNSTPEPQQQVEEGMPDRTPPDDTSVPPENEADQTQQQQAQPQQPQDPNQPKTPEQLFKELQQLEQQKQPR